MSKFYKHVLRGTLKEFVEGCLQHSIADQLSLLDELAILRDVHSQALALYQVARDSGNADPTMMASAIVVSCIDDIARTAKVAANIRASERQGLSVYAVDDLLALTVRELAVEFGDEQRARGFEARLRDAMGQYLARIQGTGLTPDNVDDTVRAMDAMTAYADRKGIDVPNDLRVNGNGRH